MSVYKLTRREFVAGAALTGFFSGITATKPKIALGLDSNQVVRIRPNIANLTIDHPILEAFRSAVRMMMALPVTDRRNWYRQAKIHNDYCAHGNWFFLPWHREYLRHFENIVREISGYEDFVLPYWDWITNRQIPVAFWASARAPSNELDPASLDLAQFERYDDVLAQWNSFTGRRRNIAPEGLVGEDGLFTSSSIAGQLDLRNFVDFASGASNALRTPSVSSTFEDSFHGTVHVDIGGPMRGFFSPLDPIFWLHHANVDRLWTLWRARNAGSLVPVAWRSFTLPEGMFATSDGSDASAIQVASLENSANLGIAYEPVPGQETSIARPEPIGLLDTIEPIGSIGTVREVRSGETAVLGLPVADKLRADVFPPHTSGVDFLAAASSSNARPRIIAEFGIPRIASESDVRLRLFLNCDYLSPSTPSTDPHFVTRLSLFGLDHIGESHRSHDNVPAPRLRVDLAHTLDAIRRTGEPDRGVINLQVQALPRGSKSTSKEYVFSISDIEISIVKRRIPA